MKTTVLKSSLSGRIAAVPAKTYAHRILICAALCDKPTLVTGLFDSEDIVATTECLQACGVTVVDLPEGRLIVPPKGFAKSAVLDCAECGSTFRFMLPVAAALGIEASFVGRGRLPERPIGELLGALSAAGVSYSGDKLPFTSSGKLCGDEFEVDGSASSQFVTGTLLAMAALGGTKRLKVTGKRVSGSYINITLDVMKKFGVKVTATEDGFTVTSPTKLRSPEKIAVEGDWSNSAFWLVAGAIGDTPITVCGLNASSVQGDRAVIDVLKKMNAKFVLDGDSVTALPSILTGCEADCSDCPDLMPILSVAAAFANGETVLRGADRLRIKECDRMQATLDMLRAVGTDCRYENDAIIINGKADIKRDCPNFVCRADHRMIMAATILATKCGGNLDDVAGVKKSYPHFFEDFKFLGGKRDGNAF